MHATLEKILNNLEPVQLPLVDLPTDIKTAVEVFHLYIQLTRGRYYSIELLSNHYSCLYGNGGRKYLGLVPNEDVITLAQELVKRCSTFYKKCGIVLM